MENRWIVIQKVIITCFGWGNWYSKKLPKSFKYKSNSYNLKNAHTLLLSSTWLAFTFKTWCKRHLSFMRPCCKLPAKLGIPLTPNICYYAVLILCFWHEARCYKLLCTNYSLRMLTNLHTIQLYSMHINSIYVIVLCSIYEILVYIKKRVIIIRIYLVIDHRQRFHNLEKY